MKKLLAILHILLLCACHSKSEYGVRIVRNKCGNLWAVRTHPDEFFKTDRGQYWVHVDQYEATQFPDSISAAKAYAAYYNETILNQAVGRKLDSIYKCSHTYN